MKRFLAISATALLLAVETVIRQAEALTEEWLEDN
jgi:hypothetical protein